jgi:hypothetical protein
VAPHHIARGVSGSKKSNWTNDSNQSKPEKKSIFMVRIKNRTEPIENWCCLVRFPVPILRTDEQTEQNQYIYIYIFKFFFFF